MRFTACAFLLIFAASLSASHTVTSVQPNVGLVWGPTAITINGSGFTDSAEVFVGDSIRAEITAVTPTQIKARVAARAHGEVASVLVRVSGHDVVLERGFRWDQAATSSNPADYKRYLVPVTGRNLPGANGSLWSTEFTLYNGYHTALAPIWNCCSPDGLPVPSPVILPDQTIQAAINARGDGTDGAFVYLPKEPSSRVGMSLRVRDLSRNAQNFGTEIPLVTEADYYGESNVPMQLVDVPTDPKYRATLRIYGPDEAPVTGVRVQVFAQPSGRLIEEYQVDLHGIVTAVFNPFPLHPSYVQLDPLTPAVRASGERVRIALYARRFSSVIPPPAIPLWAFVTITNNETQQVTTITPKR